MLPEDCPAQVKQHIMKALLLRAFGGQLQDLGVAAKQLAGVAGCGRSLHLISGEHPHLHAGFVERLYGVSRFFLQPIVEEKNGKCTGRGVLVEQNKYICSFSFFIQQSQKHAQ